MEAEEKAKIESFRQTLSTKEVCRARQKQGVSRKVWMVMVHFWNKGNPWMLYIELVWVGICRIDQIQP
jgi:hypothetical protein